MKIFINFMKTKVLFLVAFFAIAISASAQFNVGVKAGFMRQPFLMLMNQVSDPDFMSE